MLTAVMPVVAALMFGMFESIAGRVFAVVLPLFVGGTLASALTPHADNETANITAPFLIGLALVLWPGTQAGVVLHRVWSDAVGPISVAEAPVHVEAVSFTFNDARILEQQLGVARSTTIQGDPDDSTNQQVVEHIYIVAPLVGEAWTSGDEVPAWLIVDNESPGPIYPELAAIRVRGREEHGEARQAAIERHGLRAVEDAPLLRARDASDDEVSSLRRYGLIYVCGVGLWLLGTLIAHFRRGPAS